ncbi:MAG: hypothetical protein HY056_03440 [Proteobacteria bacterium]|nr:hypothetical protein [Pseudomonadota bacterium]
MTRHAPISTGAHDRPHAPLLIRRVEAIPVALPLREPVRMAGETVTHACNVIVRIEAADATVGWGEASPSPNMTGDTQGSLLAAIAHLTPPLIGADAWDRAGIMRRLSAALSGNGGAHSAIEMALLDLAGRSAGVALHALLGGAARAQVAPMWILGNPSLAQDVAQAKAKAREGFRFFKLKIGTKALAGDIATTHAVRAALGPNVALCADANCGIDLAAARRYVTQTQAADLRFLEQPLAANDLDGLARLAGASSIPIGADEGIHSPADIEAHASAGAAGLSLKLIKLGGMSRALAAAALCERLGLRVNVACKIAESSIAAAAAIHFACLIGAAEWGVSLSHFYLADDLARRPPPLKDGIVALPSGPGLGIEIDEAALARYRRPA